MMALAEKYDGDGLTCWTKTLGGNAVAELYTMRQFVFRSRDFESVARREGVKALRERLRGAPFVPTEDQLREWIEMPLQVLAKVIAHRLN
jgi:hypothetical protein